jgi:SAM domain (Sterile alpha motif)
MTFATTDCECRNMDIVVWLRSLGLGKYEAAFRENEIDGPPQPDGGGPEGPRRLYRRGTAAKSWMHRCWSLHAFVVTQFAAVVSVECTVTFADGAC